MQEKKQYLSVLSWIICLSVLAATLGCGETAKRASGKELRNATKQAKNHYEKARIILANYYDGYNNPEVSRSLGAAEKILTAALREHGQGSDPEDTPEGEIENARTMLGMVYQLRGTANLWQINAIISEFGIQELQTDILLGKVQGLHAVAMAYKQGISGGKIAEMLSEAQKNQKTVTEEIKALNAKISKQAQDIKILEEKINKLNTQAAALNKESLGNVSPEQGLKKLQEAQSVESESYKNEELLAAQQRQLEVDKKNLLLLQIKLEKANGIIAACQTQKQSADTQGKSRKEALEAREKQIQTCWADILASQQKPLTDYPGVSQNSMVKNCQLAQKLAKQGESDFGKARKEFAAAGRMAGKSNTTLIDDQAKTLIDNAAIVSHVMELQTKVKNLTERITTIRKSMDDLELTTEPVAPGITKFLAGNANLGAKVVESYRQAIKLRAPVERKIRDAKERTKYQRGLIKLYEEYASSLRAVGSIDQAAAEIKKADDLRVKLSKIK